MFKRHRRRRTKGEVRRLISEINTEEGQNLGSSSNTDSGFVASTFYRDEQKKRIVGCLLAICSLLVVGAPGIGKTTVMESVVSELTGKGFLCAVVTPTTPRQFLLSIAHQLGVETENLEGKRRTISELMEDIPQFLSKNTAFLIIDDADRLQIQLRCWLEKLYDQGQPMLLLASYPPDKDIFRKLPPLELEPLNYQQIREIMQHQCRKLNIQLSDSTLAILQQRCGGNPMLAQRVVKEEYMGLEESAPDHRQWLDGTPCLIALLMIFTISRFVGLAFNNTSLYLIGGIVAVAVSILQLFIYSLPRKSSRLGR